MVRSTMRNKAPKSWAQICAEADEYARRNRLPEEADTPPGALPGALPGDQHCWDSLPNNRYRMCKRRRKDVWEKKPAHEEEEWEKKPAHWPNVTNAEFWRIMGMERVFAVPFDSA